LNILHRFSYPALFLVGLAVTALVQRLYCVDCQSLWYDEVESLEVVQRGIYAIFNEYFGWVGNQTPSYYLLVWSTAQMGDPASSAALVRSPLVLAGALIPLVVYGLGRELFGRMQGAVAAVLVALSSVLLDYSHDLRPYSLLALFTALSVYTLLLAERTVAPRWWLAFALAMVANVLSSYMAILLVLPSLAPYLLWLLWRLWRARRTEPRDFIYPVLSLLFIGAVCAAMLLGMLGASRTPIDLSRFSPVNLVSLLVIFTGWYVRTGMPGALDTILHTGFFALSVLGAYGAVKRGSARGAVLCWLLVLTPVALLAVLMTTNRVVERYAIFSIPFYILLASNALAPLVSAGVRAISVNPVLKTRRVASLALLALLLTVFVLGAFSHRRPGQRSTLAYRPDFRSVAAYLSREAQQGDLITFLGWDFMVADFYWRGNRPASVFSAYDPRLPGQSPEGSIYWVVSCGCDLSRIGSAYDWSEVQYFANVVVLKEGPQAGVAMSMDRLASGLEGSGRSGNTIAALLRGTIHQSRGDVGAASAAYLSVRGDAASLGAEYLRTAEGFARHGQLDTAWREALMSKSIYPQSPDLHAWMAEALQRMGFAEESRVEAEISEALQMAQGRPSERAASHP
jgi:hypothetical protein